MNRANIASAGVVAWALLHHGHAAAAPADAGLRYDGEVVSAELDGIPLASVLEELERTSGVRVRYIEPGARTWPVSASFQGLPMEKAVRRLLDGVSYVYYANRRSGVILVLASASTRQHIAQSTSEAASELDRIETSGSEEASMAQLQADAEIERNIAQLRSGTANSRWGAIVQLTGIQDQRATQALASVATEGADREGARLHAVSALVQTALARPGEESAALHALKQLARDKNANIRTLVQNTLHDIEQQRKEIAAVNSGSSLELADSRQVAGETT